ncbi:MAG: methyltransferase type 12 [uncultured bacterium]|nr:MAG: methyltransferase type 12 [uncultured bacterium]
MATLNYNQVLFRLVPGNVSEILEIGCAGGDLGLALKQREDLFKCRYQAIEYSKRHFDLAKTRLDQVFHADAEQFDYNSLNTKFDVIIFGDSFEHMKDPEGLLDRLIPLLKDNGLFLFSIPNVRHFYIIDCLIRGFWDYTGGGLLDKTHFHLFTLNSFYKLVLKKKLKMAEVQSIFKNLEWLQEMIKPDGFHPDFVNRYNKLIENINKPNIALELLSGWFPGISFTELDLQEILTVQFVIKVTKN